MSIKDEKEAAALAAKLAAEMVSGLDARMLAEAKEMGMATSVFAAQIEEYRARFNAQVAPALADREFFAVAVAKLLLD